MAGNLTLIFDEQKVATLDKFSVDFRESNVAIAYDDVKDSACVSIYDRVKNVMRYYDVVDGELVLSEQESLGDDIHPNQGTLDLGELK